MIGLTRRQAELLSFLSHCQDEQLPPSFGEMAIALGASSKSVIYNLLGHLEERGHIRVKRDYRGFRYSREIKVLNRDRLGSPVDIAGNMKFYPVVPA